MESPEQRLQSEPTTEAEVTPTQQVSLQAKSNRKKKIVWASLLSLVVVAVCVALYMVYLGAQSSDSSVQSNDSKTTQPKPTPMNAEKLMSAIKGKLAGTVVSETEDVASPSYKPSSYGFFVRSDKAYGVRSTSTKSIAAANLTTIQNKLEEEGFSAAVHQKGDDVAQYDATYANEDITCSVSDTKPYQPTADDTRYQVSIGCADITSYDESAKKLQPFANAYAKATPDADISEMVFGSEKVSAGANGHQRAQVSIGGAAYGAIGGFAGLFFMVPGEDWTYWRGVQSVLECSEFNTDALRQAFVGEPCIDANSQQSTVAL